MALLLVLPEFMLPLVELDGVEFWSVVLLPEFMLPVPEVLEDGVAELPLFWSVVEVEELVVLDGVMVELPEVLLGVVVLDGAD